MPELIGFFGGTFDPPHIGHQILAAEARAQLALDRLLWVLTPDPPHKKGQTLTLLKHRLAMTQLTISGDADFELSWVDLERPGPHYALDTVNILAKRNPGAGIVLLMGGDSLRDLPTWHRPAEVVAACHFMGVMHRPGDAIDLDALEAVIPGVKAKVRYVDAPPVDIASHYVRARIAEGRPFRYFLPPAVYEYVLKHKLYR